MEHTKRTERLGTHRIEPPISLEKRRDTSIGADRRVIFVSSTEKDLSAYRQRVAGSIERMRQIPNRMEAWTASPETPLVECMRRVEECDALVAIVAHCYGWVPPDQQGAGEGKSITWLEVEHTLRLQKKVFAFILDEGEDWSGPREQDRLKNKDEDATEVQRAVRKLEEFKQYLRDKVKYADGPEGVVLGLRGTFAF